MITIPAGAVAVFNSSCWHGGTLKKNDARRRMLHLTYTRRDLKQQLPQQEYLTKAFYDRLSEPQRFLLDVVDPDTLSGCGARGRSGAAGVLKKKE